MTLAISPSITKIIYLQGRPFASFAVATIVAVTHGLHACPRFTDLSCAPHLEIDGAMTPTTAPAIAQAFASAVASTAPTSGLIP